MPTVTPVNTTILRRVSEQRKYVRSKEWTVYASGKIRHSGDSVSTSSAAVEHADGTGERADAGETRIVVRAPLRRRRLRLSPRTPKESWRGSYP